MRLTPPTKSKSLTLRLSLLLLALLALPLLSGGPGAAAAPPPPQGPNRPQQPAPEARTPYSALDTEGNPNIGKGFTMALLDSNRSVSSMGFNWVAYTVDWGTSEPNPGQYDWADGQSDVDNIINSVAATNLNVMLRIGQSPAWANGRGQKGWYPPTDAADFGRFAGQLASYVAGKGMSGRVAYEIWNEPNLSENWGGNFPNPVFYTAMVREAYPRIKRGDSRALVVAGAVTTVGFLSVNSPQSYIDDLQFLRQMYDAGAKDYFDVLSDHPYGFGDAPEVDPRTVGRTLVFRRAELHRELMIQRGDAAKPIWATEIGWAIDPATVGNCRSNNTYEWYFTFNEQQQADYLVRSYRWASSYWSWMGAMFIFNYDFNAAPWYDRCYPFDFFSVKGRPAEAALRNMAFNPPATYTALPTVTAVRTATPTPTSRADLPPAIDAVRVNPPTAAMAGGSISVEVDGHDEDSTPIEFVQFTLTYPDNSTQVVPMSLATGTSQRGTWRGSFDIPANSSGASLLYRVQACVVEYAPTRGYSCAAPVEVNSRPWRFWDVAPDFWAYVPVEYLAGQGYLSGYGDGSFKPNNLTTRSQFSKMIVLAEGWEQVNPANPSFNDVGRDNAFYAFIETAYAQGIISGYGDGSFKPFNSITRAQISKILALAEGWPEISGSEVTFRDVQTNFWAYSFVEAAVRRGVVSGYDCGAGCLEFRPNNNATRAQLSKMLFVAVTAQSTATSIATATSTPPAKDTPTTTATAIIKAPSATATATPTQTPTTISKGSATATPTPTTFVIP